MSHRISAASRPSSAVFFNVVSAGADRLPQLQFADFFRYPDQLLNQLTEAVILVELPLSHLHSRTGRDNVSDGLARYRMG